MGTMLIGANPECIKLYIYFSGDQTQKRKWDRHGVIKSTITGSTWC